MTSQLSNATQQARRPSIALISLDQAYASDFENIYADLIIQFAAQSTLQRCNDVNNMVDYLTNTTPSAIIFTDPGIATKPNARATEKLKEYVSNGGTAIFACTFSSFITPPQMSKFWSSNFYFPWQSGSYLRTEVRLNAHVAPELDLSKCVAQYSTKALFLKNVNGSDALYSPPPGAVTESLILKGDPVDTSEAAVVWARFGNGRIGYIGDVNGEEGSEKVVLAMCGLQD